MSNLEDPQVVLEAPSEHTSLLHSTTHDSPTPHHRKNPWYWPWDASYWAAVPVIFLTGLAYGPAFSFLTPMVKELFCERGIPTYIPGHHRDSLPSNDTLFADKDCDSAEYSAAVAKFTGITYSLSAIIVTMTVRFWSAKSDSIGRKKAILIWTLVSFVSQSTPIIIYYNKGASLYLLWLAAILEGAVGSVTSLIALTHAYASDVTGADERTVVFGRVIAAWYTGMGIGSAVGGRIVKRYGVVSVFWWVPAMFLLDSLYVCLIPESLSKKAMRKSRSAQLSGATLVPVSEADVHTQSSSDKTSTNWFDRMVVKRLVPDQMPNRLGGKYSLLLLMVTAFLALMAIMGAVFQVSNYLLFRFKWSLTQISYVGVIQGLSRLVSLTLLLPLVKRFSPSEPVASIHFDLKIVVMGLVVEALTMLLYGVTTVGEGFYVGGATGSIGTLFFPALRGILSQSVTPDLIGQALGTLAMFESFSTVLAPLVGSWVYAGTLETWPSAVFYAAAFATFLSALLAVFVFISHKRSMH
ncbi:Hippocampus abundant transcript 1 protein [Podila clonocystis]|nr:Hippocampus abundant transcript 1 protein [Podila clonocystis]